MEGARRDLQGLLELGASAELLAGGLHGLKILKE